MSPVGHLRGQLFFRVIFIELCRRVRVTVSLQNPEFRILDCQNPEFKSLDGQNPEFKILEFKILDSQNLEFRILEVVNSNSKS